MTKSIDIHSGRSYRGDAFEVQEYAIPGGTQFSELSLTLYMVRDGNVELGEIDDAEFASGDNMGDKTLSGSTNGASASL